MTMQEFFELFLLALMVIVLWGGKKYPEVVGKLGDGMKKSRKGNLINEQCERNIKSPASNPC
jgi:Sec-independent protein translocase protein TatA